MMTTSGTSEQDLLRTTVLSLDPRPYKPFKSSEEYLYAMKEDLAEWLRQLYCLPVTTDNFLEVLENGVILCKHANNVHRCAVEFLKENTARAFDAKYRIPDFDVVYNETARSGTFFSRDNVHNFIYWCRKMGIRDCLLFESDDLVLRKNEKSFILCLLEVARRGSRFGMPAPMLVRMEREIDKDQRREDGLLSADEDEQLLSIPGEAPLQLITNDLKSLDELVRDHVEKCTCPVQFPMIKLSEGKYRIGDTKVLIYIRVLRNHVMVRVGGGWDTLQHYLDKHDPCRCHQGHRTLLSSRVYAKSPPNGEDIQMHVEYEREDFPSCGRRSSTGCAPIVGSKKSSPHSILKNASECVSRLLVASSLPSSREDDESSSYRGGATSSGVSSPATTRSPVGDSGSEGSDEGYRSSSRGRKNSLDLSGTPTLPSHRISNSGIRCAEGPRLDGDMAPPTPQAFRRGSRVSSSVKTRKTAEGPLARTRAVSVSPSRQCRNRTLSPLLLQTLYNPSHDSDDKLLHAVENVLQHYRAQKSEGIISSTPKYRRGSLTSAGSRIPLPVFYGN